MGTTWSRATAAFVAAGLLISATACRKGEAEKAAIQNIGSDTMVNLAQAWAEEYARVKPEVSVEVSGGGSGVGIAALINGTAHVANASRGIEPKESEKAKALGGAEPKEHIVGYDALAIYVHKDNPLAEISIEELGEIYREGGTITRWSQLGVGTIPGSNGDRIIRVSRQNSSGTYQYFREVVAHNVDLGRGSLDMNGSKEVVELVANTPGAIGYSGMGYATEGVKRVSVAPRKGARSVPPSIATVRDKSYPIARAMYMYTPGEPPPEVKAYIGWVLSPAGQKLVEMTGYVPLEGDS